MLPPFNYFDKNPDVMATTRSQVSNYAKDILASNVKRMVFLQAMNRKPFYK